MADDHFLGNSQLHHYHASLGLPAPAIGNSSQNECELLGFFGWIVQGSLALLSIGSLVSKNFFRFNFESEKIHARRNKNLESFPT